MRVLISALILIIAYLLVTGCQSLQPQSNPTRLPEPTPTTRPSEPTPTAVSGTPVATPVPSPSATSPPAATHTTAPVLPATPTTSVATTPTTVTDTGIAAIRDYLDQRRREGASVEEIANEVNGAPLPAGTNVRALPVAASAEGELPIVLVVYHAPTISQGHAIFWWERDELRHQRFASDEFPDGSGPGAIGPRSPFVAARQQVRDATVELGIVYDASFGGSAESQVFRLFRLEQGSWRTLWDGLADGGNNWKTSHANVTLANASSGSPDAFARMVLRSSSWNDPDGKGGFFLESNPGPHRYFVDVWERRGDRYELTESRVEPSAYATLVEFVYRLSQGRDVDAAMLVTRPELVERAKSLGLDQKPATPWLIDLSSPEIETRGPITIVEGPPATIQFEERNGEWLIRDIALGTPGDG